MPTQKKRAPRFRVGDDVMVLYGLEKVAGKIVEDRGSLGDYGRRLYRVRINPGEEDEATFEMPEENIEVRKKGSSLQESPGIRQEFDVSYQRNDRSNKWTATTRRGKLYRGVKAKGAIGYATAKRETESEGEENFGIVTVLVDCEQSMLNAGSRVIPSAWQDMTVRARLLADQMFRSRHPEACIVHEAVED